MMAKRLWLTLTRWLVVTKRNKKNISKDYECCRNQNPATRDCTAFHNMIHRKKKSTCKYLVCPESKLYSSKGSNQHTWPSPFCSTQSMRKRCWRRTESNPKLQGVTAWKGEIAWKEIQSKRIKKQCYAIHPLNEFSMTIKTIGAILVDKINHLGSISKGNKIQAVPQEEK